MDLSVGLEPSEGYTSAEIAALKRYQYRPVDKSNIRCVRLDSSAGYLQGHFSTHDRLKGGFTALSYEWGSSAPTFQHAMWITDEHGGEGFLPMTENLSNAVKDVQRSSVQSKSFFIDQLCINQKDNKEKSIQVAGMSKVYKYADQVVCYLGPSGKLDSEALQLLQRLDAHFGDWFEGLDPREHEFVRYHTTRGRPKGPFESFSISRREMALLKPLEEIVYDGGWTKRLWMCQEVLLNKELKFLRGSRLLVARSIFLFMLCYFVLMREHHSLPSFSFLAIRSELLASMYKYIHIAGRFDPIPYVMGLFSTRHECSDPRDKIYGVLGLVRDNLGIIPDYEADVADVYTDLAWRCIQRGQSLDICEYIFQQHKSLQESSIPTDRQHWPTWVPRFEKVSPPSCIGYATGSTIPKAEVEFSQRMLKIKGWQIEHIQTLCGQFDIPSPFPHSRLWALPLDWARQFIKIIEAAREALVVKGVQEAESKLCYGLMNGLHTPATPTAKVGLPSNFAADRAIQSLINIAWLRSNASFKSQRASDTVFFNGDHDHDSSLAGELLRRMEVKGHSLCITTTGKVIIAPMAVRPGDIIALLPGGCSVYVLRALEDDNFILMGPAFAHGYMLGEGIRDPDWTADLWFLMQKLLRMSPRTDGEFPDLKYCIGCVILSAPQVRLLLNQEDGVKKIESKAMSFLHASIHDQVESMNQAVFAGLRTGTNEDVQWRQKWWNMIEQWIEAGMIRAPEWMGKLRTFTIR